MAEALKYDAGKPQLSYIPRDFYAVLMEEVVPEPDRYAVISALESLNEAVFANSKATAFAALTRSLRALIQSYGQGKEYIATSDLAAVMAFGAKKYARNNWMDGMAWSRLADAGFRHMVKYLLVEELDDESNIDHRGHAMFCVTVLIHYIRHNIGTNDLIQEGQGK